jgi:hypothetical protein
MVTLFIGDIKAGKILGGGGGGAGDIGGWLGQSAVAGPQRGRSAGGKRAEAIEGAAFRRVDVCLRGRDGDKGVGGLGAKGREQQDGIKYSLWLRDTVILTYNCELESCTVQHYHFNTMCMLCEC